MMQRAQAIAAKAIADQAAVEAAGASDPSRKRERDAEDPDRAVRARSQSPDRGEPSLLPPQAFSGGGGGGGGGLVIVEGTAGHEGRIIGRGGAMIRELQDRHGVRIQIKRPEGVTEVSGAGADAAAAEIRKIIADAQTGGGGGGGGPTQPPTDPNAVSETIMCDGVESRIIGKGGQNIRALMHRTGAHVRVISEVHQCIITGAPHTVAAAAAEVRDIIANFRATGSAGGAGPAGGGGYGGGGSYGGGYGGGYAAPQQQGYGGGGYGGGYAPPQQGYGGGGGYAQSAHPHGHGSYGGYAQPGPDPYAGVGYGGGDPAAAGRGPAPTGATGLPDGWQELSSDGQVYYWNTHTNQTQYERPQ